MAHMHCRHDKLRAARAIRGEAQAAAGGGREAASQQRRAALFGDSFQAHGSDDDERTVPLPPPGSPERDDIEARVRELKAVGLTHMAVAERLGIEVSQVNGICRRNGIMSARRAQGGHRRAS